MPNHITNRLTFSCSEEEFTRIAESVRRDGSFLGSVDFNRIRPMPEELDIEAGSRGDRGLQLYRKYLQDLKKTDLPEQKRKILESYLEKVSDDPEVWTLGKAYYENIEKYRAPHWYDWCIRNWGTKWNAYDCEPAVPQSRELRFLTAWNGVPELVTELSERFPETEISYAFADEDIGRNVGVLILKNGVLTRHDLPAPGSREAFELSADIQRIDLHELGLFLSRDGLKYEYRESGPSPEEKLRPGTPER